MKKYFVWMLAPALIFGAIGCKKKEDGGQAGKPDASSELSEDPIPSDPTVPTGASISVEKRAELLGFARHMPQDAEYLISIHNGSDAARRVMASKVWKTFATMSGMQPAGELEEGGADILDEVLAGPAAMLGEEMTLAMGKGTSEQLQNLVKANARSSYFQMSALVQMLDAEMSEDDASNFDEEQFILELIKDPKSGVGLLEKLNMPPLYLAFKTTEENREMINQQVSGGLQIMGMLEDFVKPVTIERGDASFKGFHLVGENIAKMMAESREDMEEFMPAETASQLTKAVADKNLYVVNGIYKDYVVVFIGSSPDDLVFAEDIGSSLVGGNALAFCDSYASKDLLAVFYGDGEGLKAVLDQAKGSFADMSAGIRDGLSNSDNFGDTRNIDALLHMVEEREAALQALRKVHGGGTVAYFEDGLKIESYGGFDAGYHNWNASNKMASLGDNPDVMLFANVNSNADYDTKMRDYIETLFETVYAGAMKATELPIEDGDMEQFKGYMQLFDTKFRPDLLAFWEGFSNGYDGSLGQERALVIDLEGAMPAFPGVPQSVVDSAKFPRATWIAPVQDRAKLAGAWKKMNGSMTNMAATISEMIDKDFPMQKPLSSDKDDSKTWFFPLPFFNDDFLPSVTVNDNWFAASTSKLQAVDLIKQAEAGGDTSQGMVMKVNFKRLQAYVKEMAAMVEKNADDLHAPEEGLKMAKQIIEAFSDMDSMNMHVRREKGQLRSSFHFKVAE